MRSNNLSSIPDDLTEMKSLVKIDLSHNKLQQIPVDFHAMPNLVTFDLTANPILGIPNSVINAGAVAIKAFLKDQASRDPKVTQTIVTLSNIFRRRRNEFLID